MSTKEIPISAAENSKLQENAPWGVETQDKTIPTAREEEVFGLYEDIIGVLSIPSELVFDQDGWFSPSIVAFSKGESIEYLQLSINDSSFFENSNSSNNQEKKKDIEVGHQVRLYVSSDVSELRKPVQERTSNYFAIDIKGKIDNSYGLKLDRKDGDHIQISYGNEEVVGNLGIIEDHVLEMGRAISNNPHDNSGILMVNSESARDFYESNYYELV